MTFIATASWPSLALAHGKQHPYISLALLLSLMLLVLLLAQGMGLISTGQDPNFTRYALLGGGAGFAATLLGALPALLIARISQRLEDVLLGFAAGMMLAAAAFSLLLPGLEAGKEFTGNALTGAALVILGMALGVGLMLGLDEFTPHQHGQGGPCGAGHERCSKAWLFVFAIALHNLPEGMAIGVSFAQGDLDVGLPLTSAIALQDIPEGLAVALTLRAVGFSSLYSVVVAAASGLLEPVGAWLGVSLVGGWLFTYPIGLGLAAGAMIFVVSHEVIPETHANGHQTSATLGLMLGFALMMVLDTTLG